MWKSWRAALCGMFFVAGACAPAMAKEASVYTPTFSNTAVSGYDPVAYFSEQKPVKGNS